MDERLRKRISDAVMSEGASVDDELSREIEADEEARAYLDDVRLLDRRLASWGHEEPPREYWRAFTKRLSGQLDTAEPASDTSFTEPVAPDQPGEGELPPEEPPEAPAEPPGEADVLGSLAALAGHSTVPPLGSFDDDRLASQVAEDDEDSGMIDLGALARAQAPSKDEDGGRRKVAGAAAPAGVTEKGEALSVPVQATAARAPAAGEKKNTGLYAVVAVLVVALLVVGYFAVKPPADEAATGDRPMLAEAPAATPAAPAIVEGERGADLGQGAEDQVAPATDVGDQAGASEDDVAGGAEAAPSKNGHAEPGRSGSHRDRADRHGDEPAPSPAQPAAPEAPPSSKTASVPVKSVLAAEGSGGGDLDDLLARATGAEARSTKTPAKREAAEEAVHAAVEEPTGDPGLPPQPSRSQVRRAMSSVAGQVMACKNLVESPTRVNASVNVASSGLVESATVSGGSPALQDCVERAVRRARFPAFSEPTFVVSYPFVLNPEQ